MATQATYTLEEARALVPVGALRAAPARRRAPAARRRSADARSSALLDHLESLGIVVRDLDAGLVDFPTLRDGEPAWLCWRLSDADLGYWHTTREGFASRQPL